MKRSRLHLALKKQCCVFLIIDAGASGKNKLKRTTALQEIK